MNSLGSLHFSLIEIRRLDGNDALGHVHCPHPLISNQSPLCWLTRRIWSIIRTIRCMESTLYTSITVQRFPTACLPNYCVYMTNCRLMCSSLTPLHHHAVTDAGPSCSRRRQGDR